MPLNVPGLPGANNPVSPMAKPSDENLLMAAAEMQRMGRLEPTLSRPQEQETPRVRAGKRAVRKLKIVK